MNRVRLSVKGRAEFFRDRKGICALCGGKINGHCEAWDIDHIIALELGGTDEPDNWQLVHQKCHRRKTVSDVGMIAKAKRREARHNGARRAVYRWGYGKGDPVKKKISGEVVPR